MTAASSPENSQETVIGKYRPILELGRGGMANVYLCMLRGLGGFSKLQVVKRLRPEFAEEPDFRTMFLEEARLAARINHLNVVQTNEVGIDGNNLFIAMEYLEGQSLEELIRRASKVGKPLTLAYYLPILVDALRGLDFAHELKDFQGRALKVIHRDVSPHNIFVTYDGQVKVVDFGIAKAADSSHETRTGIIKGKVAYMAPEQISSKNTVDRRADLFAIGAILWRALVGKRLWRGMNDMEILVKITSGDIPSPKTEKPDLDDEIVGICVKALAPNANERYQNAQEMIAALEDYMGRHEQATSRQVGALVGELFADRRAEIAQAIEKRIAQAEASPTGWDDVQFAGPMSRASYTPSSLSGASGGYMSARTDVLGSSANSSAALPSSEDASGAILGTESPTLRPPQGGEKKRSKAFPIISGIAVVGMIAVAAIAMTRPHATSATPTTETSAQPTPSATTATGPTAKEVKFNINVVPADAVIQIDDQPLTSSRFYQDGVAHRVRVSADQYEPDVKYVTFDSATVTLDFNLRRVKSSPQHNWGVWHAAPGPKHDPLPAPSASVAPPTPTASTKPPDGKLHIDHDSDPWGTNSTKKPPQ